ncbi:hypothetical protein M5X04_26740 [Paenibacillus alvei]|uniref:Tetratricopeptide repeat protein n=1 Tax=Paenibacillus alvei TaxID=44250 RepID=A0ABT4EIG6_PAEAL|nr:hypothetical protein [Paenibacillus alvei]MCY9532910.1 hypothetical protein [Paenibacillus alvei]
MSNGLISYLGIEDWWTNLPSEHREELRHVYSNSLGSSGTPIDEGNIVISSKTKGDLYLDLARFTRNAELKKVLFSMAEKEMNILGDVVGFHFVLMSKWESIKRRLKNDMSQSDEYEKLLKSDIEIYESFHRECLKGALGTVNGEMAIPNYPAFKELALYYERMSRFDDAIAVIDKAIKLKVKEKTSFETRKEKLVKKQLKQNKAV